MAAIAAFSAVSFLLIAACTDFTSAGNYGQAQGGLAVPRDLQVIAVTIAPRVVPGGSLPVSITVKNTGSQTWKAGTVSLTYTGEPGFSNTTLTIAGAVKPNATVTASGTLTAPSQIGRWQLSWQAKDSAGSFGPSGSATGEVTCSDGVFCNGDERYINGKCKGGIAACDDTVACTTDVCDEASDRCDHILQGACAMCAAKNCNPSCGKKLCGDDGCGGSCGSCSGGLSCVEGACIVASQPGTCTSPIALLQAGETLLGDHLITGDTSTGINETVPQCNTASAAKELVYSFVVPAGQVVGIDARMTGYDTVLSLRENTCTDRWSTVGCSDDASPPGGLGSRIATLLGEGTYYLLADGYSASQVGPFTLSVHFAANCVPGCDGKYCGDDGCGGSCGACATTEICGSAGRCVKSPCSPTCNGRKCGPDGCGGECGQCDIGSLCIVETGACKRFDDCDHDKPVCKTACSSTQYCGSDCVCHRNVDLRPDLVLDKGRLQNEIVFETREFSPTSCAVFEKCVGGTGPRKLLRFTVEAINQGSADLQVPNPKLRPDLFVFSECHGHYHFKGFATYALLDLTGKTVVTGRKQAYCMEDSEQILKGPTIACSAQSDCENQSISAGWADIYGNDLDCQWIDVTGVPAGAYQLQVIVNPSRTFEEMSFENNATVIPVVVP